MLVNTKTSRSVVAGLNKDKKKEKKSKVKWKESVGSGEEEVEKKAVTKAPKENVPEETLGEDRKTARPPSSLSRLVSMFNSPKTAEKPKRSSVLRDSLTRLRSGRIASLVRNKHSLRHDASPTDEMKFLGVLSRSPQGDAQTRKSTAFSIEGRDGPESEAEPENEATINARRSRVEQLRSMNLSPKCIVCDKKVYRMERLTDSRGRPFHWDCLKCLDCLGSKSQVGEIVHVCKGEGDLCEDETSEKVEGKFVLCQMHYRLRHSTTEIVKGWAPDTYVNDGGKYEDDIKGAIASVRKSLELSMGRKPICTKCGGEIALGDKNFVVSGMERLHLMCPTQVMKTPRSFVLGAPDRFPVLLCVDAASKRAFSFLFKIDQNSKEQCLSQHRLESARLRYTPEQISYAAAQRELPATFKDLQVFDQKRSFKEAKHPITGAQGQTIWDTKSGLIISHLYKVANGVVHGLNVAFSCTPAEGRPGRVVVEALAMELSFEATTQDDFVSPIKDTQGNVADAKSLALPNNFVERISREFGRL